MGDPLCILAGFLTCSLSVNMREETEIVVSQNFNVQSGNDATRMLQGYDDDDDDDEIVSL